MFSEPYLAAVVQLTSNSDEEASLRSAHELVRASVARGARFVATPENTNFLGPHEEKVHRAQTLDGSVCRGFAELASELNVFLLLGSFNEKSADAERCFNTSVLFGPSGDRLAVYRKIHLFDVDVSDHVRFTESATVVPGQDPVVAETPLGAMGLTVCYDLRFPELYRQLLEMGSEVLLVPSAFTATTGKDHWLPLLQARAIENQCYVLAPAQCGSHDDGGLRESHGHSLIIDPWGDVLAMAADGPGVALGEIDPARVDRVRRAMPIQSHRKL